MSATQPKPSPAAGRPAPSRARPPVSVTMLLGAQSEVDAGDRCAAAGQRDLALGHYGRAVNEYLRGGMLGLAGSVARRMIERYPEVVRARMTLAALTLSEGLRHLSAGGMRNTCAEFLEYVQAAKAAGQEELAMRQLRRFAAATQSVPVRERIADFLAQLGDEQGARALRAEAVIPPSAESPATTDQRDRWLEILLTPLT